jgi:hypothetical protein
LQEEDAYAGAGYSAGVILRVLGVAIFIQMELVGRGLACCSLRHFLFDGRLEHTTKENGGFVWFHLRAQLAKKDEVKKTGFHCQ